jgi:hypothetical protein
VKDDIIGTYSDKFCQASRKPVRYYENIREDMLKYIPQELKTSLEFGCGYGGFSALLGKKFNFETNRFLENTTIVWW